MCVISFVIAEIKPIVIFKFDNLFYRADFKKEIRIVWEIGWLLSEGILKVFHIDVLINLDNSLHLQ